VYIPSDFSNEFNIKPVSRPGIKQPLFGSESKLVAGIIEIRTPSLVWRFVTAFLLEFWVHWKMGNKMTLNNLRMFKKIKRSVNIKIAAKSIAFQLFSKG